MTDSHDGHASGFKQTPPLDPHQQGQEVNMTDEQKKPHDTPMHVEVGSRVGAREEAVKDQIDGAIAGGPVRADQSSGGRVQVGETGDLHDLAARRQSQS
ncbi:hypothetical protein GGS21DRAFT_489286 [Xylaria nigripes]|nr:hypothetical protein GGS21DRAFT_489286 [Xylaria nigripes]